MLPIDLTPLTLNYVKKLVFIQLVQPTKPKGQAIWSISMFYLFCHYLSTTHPVLILLLSKWSFWRLAAKSPKLAGHVLIDKTIAYYI